MSDAEAVTDTTTARRHRFYSVTAGQQRCDHCCIAKTGGVTKVPPCGGDAVCPEARNMAHTPRWHMIIPRSGLPDACVYCGLQGEVDEWDTASGPTHQRNEETGR